MTDLLDGLSTLGFGDCETALIVGTAWANGIATPNELAILGGLWQGKEYPGQLVLESCQSLVEKGILLPNFPQRQ